MRLYISGPMTGMKDYNFPVFNAAAVLLRASGYEVENPADKGVIEGWEWADYLRYDVRKLLDCDGVANLPGWENSKGARFENYIASELGMPRSVVGTWTKKRVLSGV